MPPAGFIGWVLAMGPAGFIAVLAGWITTEVGRQPFTVYGLLRTADLGVADRRPWRGQFARGICGRILPGFRRWRVLHSETHG